MTDLPSSAADRAANASTPDGETPAGDPKLSGARPARRTAGRRRPSPSVAASSSPDPDEPPPGAANAGESGSPTAGAAPADATTADAPAPGEPTDDAPADTTPTSEPGVDAVPVLPLTAAVTDGEPPARPRRRRSLAFRFGVSFVLGFLFAIGAGAGVLYAWGQQYDGRVLPGVRVGSTELGGLTRVQAEAEIANAYGSLATGQITLTGPDGQMTTISYADVGRGPGHLGAARRGTRGRPPGRPHREPHRRTPGPRSTA